ncbi:hypothetical protein ACHAW5_007119 [Stephanodiscus triporus]|uniref:tRNA (guanine(46)-N(7))-methyltransferase n=1 Tax=Stephanodiscus triporus TaxID=2934178 RepID=A0ABD3NYX5_9STRA
MRSSHREKRQSAEGAITQHTINDEICPPTDAVALRKLVHKHVRALPKYWKMKPTAKHNVAAFEEALDFIIRRGQSRDESLTKVVLDSGCGTGRSSHLLGERYRDCVVIGIDQSLARLSKNRAYGQLENDTNVHLIRAELFDFWKFCICSPRWRRHVQIVKHYLLYPNPYPKKSRLKNRFYAHPSFPLLMMTLTMDDDVDEDKELVVRSNWRGYLDEFKLAAGVWGEIGGDVNDWVDFVDANGEGEWFPKAPPAEWKTTGPTLITVSPPLTNFEAKFLKCGEPIYEFRMYKSGTLQNDDS